MENEKWGLDHNIDGNGFWVIKEEIHMHTAYLVLDPKMSNSDTESDDDNKASHVELAGMEDEQPLDWSGSGNQLVTEGEELHTEEEANVATLKEEDAPCSKAQPIPHHVLHAPVISHTSAFSGEPDKEVHAFQIVSLHEEHITERQN